MSTDRIVVSLFCFVTMLTSLFAFCAVVASSRMTRLERRERQSGDDD